MFRALSTRIGRRGYERLGDGDGDGDGDGGGECSKGVSEERLRRVTSLPTRLFSSSKKLTPEQNFSVNPQVKQAKKLSKIHPIFGLLETRRRKKATAMPEFARYAEYVKEGAGFMDMNSDNPVKHDK